MEYNGKELHKMVKDKNPYVLAMKIQELEAGLREMLDEDVDVHGIYETKDIYHTIARRLLEE